MPPASRNGSTPHNTGGVALVLPGGGARGAYEAGALSALLPALEARGEKVSLICGTSVGAINAAHLAAAAHLPAEERAQGLVDRWRSLRRGEVMASPLGPATARSLLLLGAQFAGVPGARATSILDASPLAESLESWVDWDAVARNIDRGTLGAVCVVATSLADGRPVGFLHGRRPPRRGPNRRGLRYVRARLRAEHVRASAAIPLLFSPVEVTAPPAAAGHYIDGGTRLNAPLRPALELGAERVMVIGFEPLRRPPRGAQTGRPRLGSVGANVLDGLLVDQLVDDVHRLAAVNAYLADSPQEAISPAARAYRASRDRGNYRRVPYAIVAPEEPGMFGRLAHETVRERYGGLRGLLAPEYPVIARICSGDRGELLSFLLFEECFLERLIQAGRRDAERWLERHPRFWCADPAHDLDMDASHDATRAEEDSVAELRLARRR